MTAFLASLVLLQLTAADAPRPVPRFEPGECRVEPAPGIGRPECGWLIVPEVRGTVRGRTLRLAVAIYRAAERTQMLPLLLLHGGPGGDGAVASPSAFLSMLRSPLARSRDIVVFDMRAAGLSEPRLCPDFYEGTTLVFNRRRPDERARGYQEAVQACAAWLETNAVDAAAYSTAASAADAIDLRRVLGYAKWDLYGVSYGAQVAEELMARDAEAIRAVVLVSPVTSSGTEAAESAFTHQRALERVFAACGAQQACHAAFPTVAADFESLYEEFAREPLEVRAAPDGGVTTVWLDGARFVLASRRYLGFVLAARLPLLLSELRRGNRAAAAAEFLGDGIVRPFHPIAHLVGCNDYGAEYAEAVARVRSRLRPAFQAIADDIREHCDGWMPAPARHSPPAVARDIPTLMMNGEIDPQGTDLHSRRLGAGLTHAYVYEVRGRGHEALGRCAQAIVDAFLSEPAHEPGATCLADAPPIPFVIVRTDATLTMVITPGAGVRAAFAGEWDGEYPLPSGRRLRFELETDGRSVRGIVRRQPGPPEPLSISDGVIRDDTITFRVQSPSGQEFVTLSGTLAGDAIVFQRDTSQAGAVPGFFGGGGPTGFTMTRRR